MRFDSIGSEGTGPSNDVSLGRKSLRGSREIRMYDVQLSIGGKDVAAKGNATFERRNPVSGDVVTRAAAASTADAIAAVTAAHAAFPGWSTLGPGARRAKLNQAAD